MSSQQVMSPQEHKLNYARQIVATYDLKVPPEHIAEFISDWHEVKTPAGMQMAIHAAPVWFLVPGDEKE